ncbi:hypothetical protein WJX81_006517 [Elliptochloris bilobata]|uniref:Protein kinase domain-containing protein n=1 Tax=Elliptochloris bilobata TaxID=381761 RepID=A0AAW1RGW0_9CHLO
MPVEAPGFAGEDLAVGQAAAAPAAVQVPFSEPYTAIQIAGVAFGAALAIAVVLGSFTGRGERAWRRMEEIGPAGGLEVTGLRKGRPVVLYDGPLGKAYEGVTQGGMRVAVRAVRIAPRRAAARRALLEEGERLAALPDCGRVAGFAGLALEGDLCWLLAERVPGAPLRDALAAGRDCSWRVGGGWIALSVARALHFLHAHGIAHLGVGLNSVLLAPDGTAVLGDLGASRLLGPHTRPADPAVGVRGAEWMAPELLLSAAVSERADVWSFGVLLWHLCTGHPPAPDAACDLEVPRECPLAVAELVQACLDEDPAARPSAALIIGVLADTLQVPLTAADEEEPRSFQVATLSAAAAAAGGRQGVFRVSKALDGTGTRLPPPVRASVRQGAIRLVPERAGARDPPAAHPQWAALAWRAETGSGSGSEGAAAEPAVPPNEALGLAAAAAGDPAPGTPALTMPPAPARGGAEGGLRALWAANKASAAADGVQLAVRSARVASARALSASTSAKSMYYDPEFEPESKSLADPEDRTLLNCSKSFSSAAPGGPHAAARRAPVVGDASVAGFDAGRDSFLNPDTNLTSGSEASASVVTIDAQPGTPSVASSAVGSVVTVSGSERARVDPYGGFAAARRALAPGSEGATSSMAAEMDAELAELGRARPQSESSGGGGMTLEEVMATEPMRGLGVMGSSGTAFWDAVSGSQPATIIEEAPNAGAGRPGGSRNPGWRASRVAPPNRWGPERPSRRQA